MLINFENINKQVKRLNKRLEQKQVKNFAQKFGKLDVRVQKIIIKLVDLYVKEEMSVYGHYFETSLRVICNAGFLPYSYLQVINYITKIKKQNGR